MRILAVVIFCLAVCMAAVPTNAQQHSLLALPYSIAPGSATIKSVLDEISKKTGVLFSYSSRYVDVDRRVRISDTAHTIGGLLHELFWDKQLSFREQDNKILIINSEATSAEVAIQQITIHGFVKEADSKEALVGAAVYVPGSGIGTVTNNYGYYSLAIPQMCEVMCSYIGFVSVGYLAASSQDIRHDILMQPAGILKEMQVVSSKGQLTGYHHIVQSDLKSRAVLLGDNDVIRTVQNLPGVQTGSGAGNLIMVRGGEPGQNLHLLDGVPLYNVDHFYGLTSVYNSDAIKSVDVYKGAFPARYGGRVSSVIDVASKDGNMQRWGGQFSMGLIKSTINVEGPLIKDKASIIVSGRRTWIDALWRPFTNDLKLNFYDIYVKANYIVDKNNRLYVSMYNGQDRLGLSSENSASRNQWGNTTVSSRWNRIVNAHLYMNTTLTYSTFNYVLHDQRQLITNGQVSVSDGYKGSSTISDVALRVQLNLKAGNLHSFEFGGQVANAFFNPAQVDYFSQPASGSGSLPQSSRSNELVFFVEDQIRLGKRVKLIPGIYSANWLSKQFDYSSIQPRLRTEVAVSCTSILYASYAGMAQFLHLISNNTYGIPTDFWIPSTATIEPEESSIGNLGFRHSGNKGLYINVEGYYKDMRNVTTYDQGKNLFDNSVAWDKKIIQGRGYSYGSEVLLRKQIGSFNVSSAYTLSWTWRQFAQLNDGKIFPFRYDRRHNYKLAILYQPNPRFEATANWVYMSGEAITLPDQIYQDFDKNLLINPISTTISSSDYTYNYATWNNYRLPAIHRLDLGFSFIKQKKRFERTWSLGVFNAYARKNIMFVELTSVYTGTSSQYKLRGTSILQFVPYVSFKLKI